MRKLFYFFGLVLILQACQKENVQESRKEITIEYIYDKKTSLKEDDLCVFPNPFNSIFNIVTSENIKGVNIWDCDGNLYVLEPEQFHCSIHWPYESEGTFKIEAIYEDKVVTQTLLKSY